MAFSVGGRVAARGLVWDVVGMEALGLQTLLQLRCAAGDLRGMAWQMLVPHETASILHGTIQFDMVQPLRTWRLHHTASLLDQLPGAAALVAGTPGDLVIEPYQMVPVLRALEMPRPRLLLADGVGLGKTVQAGLIATELLARRRAHRILVVTPAGPLLRQWEQEMHRRFGLRFTLLADAGSLAAERRRLELGGNPFSGVSLCLTTIDFAKQERVLEDLERAAWDLVVIDEAHHCVAGSETKTTQRRRLAEVLARRSDGLMLLTATPHDGNDAHFGSLLALLDPSLLDAAGLPAGLAYRNHVVRRLKQHVINQTGRALFQERSVLPMPVQLTAEPARRFHAALASLVTPRVGRPGGEALAFISLLKRSVSTLAACVATLRVVADRIGKDDAQATRERTRALRAYRRRLERYGVLDAADEAELAELEAEDIAAHLRATDAAGIRELIALGDTAVAHDPKLAALVSEIRAIRAERPGVNVLVYTEYADSQAAALTVLRASGLTGEILSINGQDTEMARSAAAERFAEVDGVILVSTDALAEGLNLHQRCRDLIHLDLPYNPNRLEQRNGRIDRYGQRASPRIRYLCLAGTFEEQLLIRLIGKFEKARAALDVMPDTLGGVTTDPADWETALFEGFAETQASLVRRCVEPEKSSVVKSSGREPRWLRKPTERHFAFVQTASFNQGGLDTGLAERQASLFDEQQAMIRTLDRSAEALNVGSYRALQQEIDRAYESFERIAVRHGWLPDGATRSGTAQLAEASRARRRGEKLIACIDVGAFVHEALAAGPDRSPTSAPRDASVGSLPARAGLELGGHASPAQFGRAHPLVQRAITRMRQPEPVVSEIKGGVASPALLLTYVAELHGPTGLAWQRVLAADLSCANAIAVLDDPSQWLHLGGMAGSNLTHAQSDVVPHSQPTLVHNTEEPEAKAVDTNDDTPPCTRSVPTSTTWQVHFGTWAAPLLETAEAAVMTHVKRLTSLFAGERQARADQEDVALAQWLRRRADALCGPPAPATRDLFAPASGSLDWRTEQDPSSRLALYAADPNTQAAGRRAANDLMAVAQERRRIAARFTALNAPVLRPLGMLMRLP